MKQLIEDLISAMEYHVEQTRPIHSTTVALQAAREAIRAQPAPVPGAITGDDESPEYRSGWNECRETMLHMLASPPAAQPDIETLEVEQDAPGTQ